MAFDQALKHCGSLGWSYGLDGKLAKAPKYQDLEGFDKSANSLFSAHVHIDRLGFIWVNLDANATPEVAWDDEMAGMDTQERLQSFDATKFHYDHSYEIVGDFNWKTLADNYNEVSQSSLLGMYLHQCRSLRNTQCYHCPTGHPALNPTSDFSKYYVKTKGDVIEHWNTDKSDEGQALCIVTTFSYPGSHSTVS